MKHVSHSPDKTQEIAKILAEQLVRKYAGGPLVIAMEGELGAGKTTFVQAFAEALGVTRNIKSPTFVLMKKYEIRNPKSETNPENSKYKYQNLYHLDCYRLQSTKDLAPLDVEEILKHPDNIILIEWAERIRDALPEDRINIKMEHLGENKRTISIAYRL